MRMSDWIADVCSSDLSSPRSAHPVLTLAAPAFTNTPMTEETINSRIPYDEIVQDALRAVIGRVLGEVEAAGGLPGGHHFYITFRTRAPGVNIPGHLLERFPEEMTIVIQNRYWDLSVSEDRFEVGLSFNQVPAKLKIGRAHV